MKFDLSDPAAAYVFGFMQADGHHYAGTGQKGRISVEIKSTVGINDPTEVRCQRARPA